MPRRRALAECHFVCNIQPLAESEVEEQSQRTGRVEQVEGRFAASVQGVNRALTGMLKRAAGKPGMVRRCTFAYPLFRSAAAGLE